MLKLIFFIILIIIFLILNINGQNFISNSSETEILNLYIITHKDFNNFISNKSYKILCDDFYQLKNKYILKVINSKNDNELFNKRIGYSEGSKIYYIWKKYKNNIIKSKYVGFNHYSRIFKFGNDIPNLDHIFKRYDVILKKRSKLRLSLKKQYNKFHNKKDLKDILDIIKNKFSNYYSVALKTLNNKIFYSCNIFIMKSEDFIEYGNFIFGVLNEFDKKNNLISDEIIKNYISKFKKKFFKIEYQRRLEGFLMERISNIFYNYHFKKILQIKIISKTKKIKKLQKKKKKKKIIKKKRKIKLI